MSFFGANKGRVSKAAAKAASPVPQINHKRYPLPLSCSHHKREVSGSDKTVDIFDDERDTSHNTSCDDLSLDTAPFSGDCTTRIHEDTYQTPPNQVEIAEILKGAPMIPPSPPPLGTPASSGSFDSTEDDDNNNCWRRDVHNNDNGLPPMLNRSAWGGISARDYPLRSANYLQNRKKQATDESVMTLWAVDLVQTDSPFSMCAHPSERLQQSLRQGTAPEFCFAVNICLPAPQRSSSKVKAAFYQFVAYFAVDDRSRLFDQNTPVGRLANKFCFEGDDSFRNATFKLIPRIVHGGTFVFRQAVGSKPVLLGQKVSQKYFRTQDYCEVLVDIASDPVAKRIVRMALGLASCLTVDLSFCLEGKTVETLPEQLLGGFRVQGLNFAEDGQRYVDAMNQKKL